MGLKSTFITWINTLGEFSLFVRNSAIALRPAMRKRRLLFLRHCEFIGVSSTGIIVVAGIFMGGVLGYQMYVSLHWFGAEALLGATVGVALFRELAPVMAAIMVTGRAGAAMAAEISTMKITEQVDALEVMAVDPIEYLVTPRVVAGMVMMPLLSVLFGGVGSLASAGVACGIMGLSHATYWEQFVKFVDYMDLVHCVVKGTLFGLVLTWIGCFCGFRTRGGARSVGLATRTTVVASCLAILLTDYMATSLLPFGISNLVQE